MNQPNENARFEVEYNGEHICINSRPYFAAWSDNTFMANLDSLGVGQTFSVKMLAGTYTYTRIS